MTSLDKTIIFVSFFFFVVTNYFVYFIYNMRNEERKNLIAEQKEQYFDFFSSSQLFWRLITLTVFVALVAFITKNYLNKKEIGKKK